MNQSEPCCVFQWGTGEDPWWISIFKWHILTAERQVGRREEQTKNLMEGNFPQRASWSRGHFNSWQTATTTAYNIWAAHHSQNEQKHSGSGWMKHSLSLFWIFFFFIIFARERTMWCEHGRIKDVDSYRGKFRSTRGNLSVASDKTVGGEGKKGLREKHTWLSPLARAKHSFCSTETMTEVSKSYFRKSYSSLSLMRRPFSVHWIQN